MIREASSAREPEGCLTCCLQTAALKCRRCCCWDGLIAFALLLQSAAQLDVAGPGQRGDSPLRELLGAGEQRQCTEHQTFF